MDHHRFPPACHGRSLRPAEKGLQLGRQNRTIVGGIVQAHPLSRRDGQVRRRQGLKLLLGRIIKQTVQGLQQVDPGQIRPPAHAGQKRSKPVLQILEQGHIACVRPAIIRERPGEQPHTGPPLTAIVSPGQACQALFRMALIRPC